jgi:hypothetical protein
MAYSGSYSSAFGLQSSPHCQLTRTIIAVPNIRGVVRVGRRPRQVGTRGLEVPQDRRVGEHIYTGCAWLQIPARP